MFVGRKGCICHQKLCSCRPATARYTVIEAKEAAAGGAAKSVWMIRNSQPVIEIQLQKLSLGVISESITSHSLLNQIKLASCIFI